MMKMQLNRSRVIGMTLVLGLCAAVPALGQVEFTFEGYAAYAAGPDQAGAVMTVYGIANPPVSMPTPIPVDFATNQYTVAITGMVVDSYVFNGVAQTKNYVFNGGTLQIYENAIAGGTAANYAVPATFTDGTMLLQAAVDDGWTMDLNDPFGFGQFSGAGIGTCDMNGGSELGTLIGMDYPLNDWTFAGTGIAEPWFPFFTVPAGYHHLFGVKVIFPYDPTPNEDASWGQVKTLFR